MHVIVRLIFLITIINITQRNLLIIHGESTPDYDKLETTTPSIGDVSNTLSEIIIVDTTTPTSDTTTSQLTSTTEEPVTCAPIPPTISFTAISSPFTILLEWEIPETNCPIKFIVYQDNVQIAQDIEANSYEITNLDACTDYQIGLASFYQDVTSSPTEQNISTQAPVPFSYSVQELQIDSEFSVTWTMEPIVQSCISRYKVVYWTQVGIDFTKYVPNPPFQLKPIIKCVNYTVEVTPQVNQTLQGLSSVKSQKAESGVTNPPKCNVNNPTKTSIDITCSTDRYSENMCDIQAIAVQCEARAENNGDFWWIVRSKEEFQEITDSTSRPEILVTLENLSEFTNYTCTAFISNEAGNSSNSEEVFIQTLEEVPSAPQNLSSLETNSSNFTIEWLEPEKVPGILINYQVLIENLGPLHYVGEECLNQTGGAFLLDAQKYSLTFEEAFPNTLYSVTVFAIDGAGNGENSTIEITTTTSTPDAPQNLNYTHQPSITPDQYNVKTRIVWEAPCNSNGPLEGFIMSIVWNHIENDSLSGSKYEYVDANAEPGNILYDYDIVELKALCNYEITIWAVLNDNNTSGYNSTINFRSPEGFPGSPDNLQLLDVNTTGFILSWKKPEPNWGTILSYTIDIKFLQPLYNISSDRDCIIHRIEATYTVESDVLEFSFGKGEPYFEYFAFVKAQSSVGYGQSSNQLTIATKSSEPQPIRYLRIRENYANTEIYNSQAIIDFEPPCRINGEFKEYRIEFVGIRDGFDDHTGTINNEENNAIIDLKPDYEYFVNVSILNQEFNSTAITKRFHSHSGVPSSSGNNLASPKVNGTSQAYLVLKKSDFNYTNGDILYYCLYLFKRVPELHSSFGFWNGTEENWPPFPGSVRNSGVFQLTPKLWEPFKEDDTEYFIIGKDQNCSIDYCNEALKEDTDYYLVIRALTKDAYRDSAALKFHTELEDFVNLGLILGLIFGLITVAVLATFVAILWRRKWRKAIEEEESARNSVTDPPSVTIKKFNTYYNNLSDNYNVVKAQFTTLDTKTKEMALPRTYATLPENKRKNRYTNILPYDETRVKLQIDEDDEIGSDYINASHIKGYSSQVEYIATQGPSELTSKDFWKMILQENVSIIVMVSQFVEQGKEKCHKYFPNNHEMMTFGENFEVKCTTELHFGIYCVRTLQVRKDAVQRHVIHMQFLEWPDFGVPSGTEHMLQFCCQLRERIKNEGGVIAVHCSAGVGRTGTLIATDILLQAIDNNKELNVFQTVLNLRKQRMNMVQTEKQYMFIHTCLRDIIENPLETTDIKAEEPLYENMDIIKSSLNDTLIETDQELESTF